MLTTVVSLLLVDFIEITKFYCLIKRYKYSTSTKYMVWLLGNLPRNLKSPSHSIDSVLINTKIQVNCTICYLTVLKSFYFAIVKTNWNHNNFIDSFWRIMNKLELRSEANSRYKEKRNIDGFRLITNRHRKRIHR